jgi:FkbM family methyltransferase
MWMRLKGKLSQWLARSPLAYVPVRVRAGLAKGARWTLLPYSMYWRGNPEEEVETFIRQVGDLRGASCWDLGAHFGFFTVGLALAVGADGQVTSVEPDPVSFARCQRHVRMNHLGNVKLFNAAASAETGEAELLLYDGLGTSTSHLAYHGETGAAATRHRVRKVRLDDLVAAGEIRPPRLIKVDVEGHGGSALWGAEKTVQSSRPAIVMSFHSPEEFEQTRRLVGPLDYRMFAYPPDQPEPWKDLVVGTRLLLP